MLAAITLYHIIVFIFTAQSIFKYCVLLIFILEYMPHERGHDLDSPQFPQHLEECLAHIKHLVNICLVNYFGNYRVAKTGFTENQ